MLTPATRARVCSNRPVRVQSWGKAVFVDVANEMLDPRALADPEGLGHGGVGDGRHAAPVPLGMSHQVEKVLCRVQVTPEEEEVSSGFCHAMSQAVVKVVTGHDDDRRCSVPLASSDSTDNCNTRKLIPVKALVCGVDDYDIDPAPLPAPRERFCVTNGAHQLGFAGRF